MSTADAVSTTARKSSYWKPWDTWVLLLPILAMAPMLLIEFQKLMNRPERQFFPLLVLIALFFPLKHLYDNPEEHERPIPIGRLRFAIATFILAVFAFVFAVVLFSPWLAHIAALLIFAAWGLGRCISVPWTTIWAWTGLLLVTVPLPFEWDESFVRWLQTSSSAACSYALEALAVPHLRLVNLIEIRGRQLFVEEACSGIGSMYALLAAAALLVLVNGRSFLTSLLVILSVPIWAMFGNFLRLLAIALALEYFDRDLSHGLDHELLGLLTFSIAALGLWMTEWLVTGFLQPLPPASPDYSFVFQTLNAFICWPNADPFASMEGIDESPQEKAAREAALQAKLAQAEAAVVRVQPWSSSRLRQLTRGLSGVVVLAGVLPAIVVSKNVSADSLSYGLPEYSSEEISRMPGETDMPEEIGDWKRVGFYHQTRTNSNFFGAHSLIWEYRKDDLRFLFSVDFPFRGFHPLEVCYSNAGWHLEEVRKVRDTDQEQWDWQEVKMQNEFGAHGVVLYAMMVADGQPFANIALSQTGNKLNRFQNLLGEYSKTVFQPLVFQVQLNCETGHEATKEELEMFRKHFDFCRRKIRPAFVEALKE